MEFAGEERRTNSVASNTKVKETFNPLLVLMMLTYPTLLCFVFVARLATFALLIPTPTVPGAPLAPTVPRAPLPSDSDSDSGTDVGNLRAAADLCETAGAGALVRTGFAFISIAFVHLFLVCYLVRGPPGASFMETHRNGRLWAWVGSLAFWFTTTCFLITYTSMARYGAHDLEWCFTAFISIIILLATVPPLCVLPDVEKVVVDCPPRATV